MKTILGWVVVVVTALFVALNLQPAQVQFFVISIQMPVAFVVIASAFMGALATYAFTSLKGQK